MIEIIIAALVILLVFLLTYLFTTLWIPIAKKFGLIGKDMNKYNHPKISEAGGLGVIIGTTIGIFTYLFLKALFISDTHLPEIYATLSAVILAGLIGFSDDILGWKKGIPQRYKPLFTTILALPFMTITLIHPYYNSFESWGVPLWMYSLILVPIGIIGTSNAVNMVAGYNGLEAGLSSIILITLAIQAYIMGEFWISYMALIMVAALMGFLVFNWYPAKVFPGDSLTYPVGTYIGALAILGNMEIFGGLLFFLYAVDLVLYLKARKIDKMGDVQAFGIPDKEGHLELPYKKIYDSCHIAIILQKKIRGYATERGVVVTLLSIQAVISAIILLLYNRL